MKVTVWNENVHEKTEPESVLAVHPRGLHETVADIIREIPGAQVTVATLDMPGGRAFPTRSSTIPTFSSGGATVPTARCPDEIVEKLHKRVLKGMGLIALHSAHYSKIFTKLMGTSCSLRWVDKVYERIFCVNPTHPIAEGIPLHFELGIDECYSEYFDIPQPDELLFTGWYENGEMFRSGCVWHRGYGKVFYFQPRPRDQPLLLQPLCSQDHPKRLYLGRSPRHARIVGQPPDPGKFGGVPQSRRVRMRSQVRRPVGSCCKVTRKGWAADMKIQWTKEHTANLITGSIIAVAGILIFFTLRNFNRISDFFSWVLGILAPFIYGFIFAYLMNPTMKFIERTLANPLEKKKPRPKLKRMLAVARYPALCTAACGCALLHCPPPAGSQCLWAGEKCSLLSPLL